MLRRLCCPLLYLILILFIYIKTPFAHATSAQAKLGLRPSDNQLKLLSQKLEFHVKDAKSILLGNLLISTENLKMTKIDDSSVLLVGPKQFMVGGLLLIKDPHGEAIWSELIKSADQLRMNSTDASSPSDNKEKKSVTSNSTDTTEVAQYTISRFDKLIEKLSLTSFFNFCIFIETTANRIQTCTPNYSVSISEKDWQLTPLETTSDDNVIIVNGTEVNDHGIIQFDQNINTVSLAAKMSSGLSLEVKTDTIPLDILDAYSDSQKIHLRLREKSNDKKVPPAWNTELNPADTFFYIEAFGQAPLRQEIAMTPKELPSDSDRPTIQNPITKSYGKSIALNLVNKPDTTFKLKAKNEKLLKNKDFTQWSMNNLKPGLTSHTIQVKNKTNEYSGVYEINLLPAWEMSLQGGSNSSSSLTKSGDSSTSTNASSFQYDFMIRKYFDQFWGITQTPDTLRWSTSFEYLTKSVRSEKINTLRLDLGYRWSTTPHHVEPGLTTRIALMQLTATGSGESNATSLLGFHLSYDNKIHDWNSFLGDSYDASLEFYPLSQSSLKQSLQYLKSNWQSRFEFKSLYFWSWSVSADLLQAKLGDVQSTTQSFAIKFGLGKIF